MIGINFILNFKKEKNRMPFDEDLNDSYEQYQCLICSGTTTFNKDTKKWECDSCDFLHIYTNKNKEGE